ncbi:MAG: hypothetical protein ACOYBX_14555, partial [Mycobacterium sp.]
AGLLAPEDIGSELPMIGVSAPTAGGAGVGAGVGAGGAPAAAPTGALPTSGLTSYTRPATSFPAENAGRPVGLKAGPLTAAELRGPTTVGPMPMAPAAAGGPRDGKGSAKEGDVSRARVTVNRSTNDQLTKD